MISAILHEKSAIWQRGDGKGEHMRPVSGNDHSLRRKSSAIKAGP
jgi:hypothetical protein